MSQAAQLLAAAFEAEPDLEQIDSVFKRQQTTALAWRLSTAAERIDRIKRVKAMVEDNAERIYAAAAADFSKPTAEVDLTEIMPVVAEARHAIKSLKSWMKSTHVMPTATTFGTRSYVQYEPKGVSLIISPWNYPVNLTLGPLVSALAAGCTAIIKPSEMTPNLSGLMVELIRKSFDESEVAIFEGDARTSQALLSLPFDHIFFTGSPAVGKIVMKAAAEHLTSVTLELGGKSPTIVDKSANLDRAAESAMWGKCANNGQTCIAPDLLYVHADVKDEFVAKCKSVIAHFYGDDARSTPDYARIVNERHHARITNLIDDAKAKGATVLHGGASHAEDCFIEPTLLGDVPADAQIMSEEIFGPVLPIIPFTDAQQVVDDINSRPKPLALYVFAKNKQFVELMTRATSAGGTCVNTNMVQYLHGNLPFGGVNNSGIGSAHGLWGFKAFSHERALVKDKFSATKLFNPPYTDFVKKMIKLTIKYMA